MKTRFKIFLTSTLILLSIASASLSAGEVKQGDWSLEYNFFDSTFITPEVASAYKIKRSKNNMLINVSLFHKDKKGAQAGNLNGSIRNLMQQQKTLKFIEIAEKGATYYIAPIRVSGKEILHFELEMAPKEEDIRLNAKFTHTVYGQ